MTFDEALKSVADIVKWRVNFVRPKSHDERDEYTQAARIGVWKAWQSWRPGAGSSWRTWAATWIRAHTEREAWGSQTQRKSLKWEAKRRTVSLQSPTHRRRHEELGDVLPSPKPTPEQVVAAREVLREVGRHMGRIERPKSGAKFNARHAMRAYAEGYTMGEIAAKYGVTLQAVHARLRPRLRAGRELMEAMR